MASASSAPHPATATTVSLKLLINKETQKVVFAEAGKPFVDFLYDLMSLPLGTVAKLVSHKASQAESFGNLYDSIAGLCGTSQIIRPRVYVCGGLFDGNCDDYPWYTDNPNTPCPNCGSYCLDVLAEYLAPPEDAAPAVVAGWETYMVTDDLKVAPHSTISTIVALNENGLKDFGCVEVKVVQLGFDEQKMASPASSPTPMTLKLLINRKAQKVVFAEAEKPFVDFFVVPHVLAAGHRHQACNPEIHGRRRWESLRQYCRPRRHVHATCGNMTVSATYVAPPAKAEVSTTTGGEGGGFVRGVVSYMVMDDLKVIPQSAISTLNDSNITDFRSLEVKVVSLDNNVGLKLLKAALVTNSVLTTVFLKKSS
ncbi:unnamed protein product [Cuscuta campestris]|uniref:DUF674 domain-containing protein n=1 Tax=Cuscuta campestris TaxID=132261 RepID=A0A484KG58_9ASTE|nr:unnamed protein product [Cuscuta campestris]